MRKTLKALVTTASLAFSFMTASAYAGTQTGTVANVSVDNNGGPYVFFMSGTHSGQPACAQDGYWAINDISTDSAKAMLATILTAYALGRQVYVNGTGACSGGYAREAVGYVIAQ